MRYRKGKVYTIHSMHGDVLGSEEHHVLEHDGYIFETFDADAGRAVDVALVKVPCGKGLRSHHYSVTDPSTGLRICYGSRNGSKDEAVARFERMYKSAWLRIVHSYGDERGEYYRRAREEIQKAKESLSEALKGEL